MFTVEVTLIQLRSLKSKCHRAVPGRGSAGASVLALSWILGAAGSLGLSVAYRSITGLCLHFHTPSLCLLMAFLTGVMKGFQKLCSSFAKFNVSVTAVTAQRRASREPVQGPCSESRLNSQQKAFSNHKGICGTRDTGMGRGKGRARVLGREGYGGRRRS